MPLQPSHPPLDLEKQVARKARLEAGLGALERLVTATPAGDPLPLPLRLAIRDFRGEIRKLDAARATGRPVRYRRTLERRPR